MEKRFRRFKEFVNATAEQPVSVQQPQNLEQLITAAYAADQVAHKAGDFSNEANTTKFLRQIDPTALNTLSPQTRDQLIVMLVHVTNPQIDAPQQAYQGFSVLSKLINSVWNWDTSLSGGHVGNTILNRLSSAIQYQLRSPFFLSYEGNVKPDDIDYYTGNANTPVKYAKPRPFSQLNALLNQIKADYLAAGKASPQAPAPNIARKSPNTLSPL